MPDPYIILTEASNKLNLAALDPDMIAAAEKFLGNVARSARSLHPTSLVATAMTHHPELSPKEALNLFVMEMTPLFAAMMKHSDTIDARIKAEREQLAPVVAAVGHRSLDIQRRVEHIDRLISNSKSRRDGKRGQLIAAGLNLAEVNSHANDDTFDLQDEREALLVEQAALERFMASRDMGDLPESLAEKTREAA